MKKLGMALVGVRGRMALAALVMFLLATLVPARPATAQGQGKYLSEASARLGKLIAKANQEGFIFTDNQFSIGGGWLKQGQENWVPLYTLNLQGGKKYRFLAAGDYDAKDVDLQVQDLNGKTVAEDVGTEPEAVVNFTPPNTAKYLVRVRLYDSDQNLPCLCLAIVMMEK
jgi:hypothetical protein